MKRFVYFLLVWVLGLHHPMNAENRGKAELLSIAESFFNHCQTDAHSGMQKQNVRARLSVVTEKERVAIVSCEGGGYVVLSKDKDIKPVLGYSDDEFTEDCPPAFLCWLECANEMTAKTQNDIAIPSTLRPYVEPLIKTRWNQTKPFNDMCPMYIKASGDSARSITGCVATAMAQLMYYYKYPQKGIGSRSYTMTHGDGSSSELSMNFGETQFDWDNMLESYTYGNYTQEQADAVATLMRACGYATRTFYKDNESGTDMTSAKIALQKYFDYDVVCQLPGFRPYLSRELLLERLYSCISRNLPALVGGRGRNQLAHAFIMDGYDTDGNIHVNWGWGGSRDGYYNFMLDDADTPYNILEDILCEVCPIQDVSNTKVIELSNAGELKDALSQIDLYQTDQLIIKGDLNAADILALQLICGTDSLGKATGSYYAGIIDLSDANIVEGGGCYKGSYTTEKNVFPRGSSLSSAYSPTSIILPKSTKTIGSGSLNYCRYVDIPNGVENIYDFGVLYGLKEMRIPSSVSYISGAYSHELLRSIIVDENNATYDSRDNCNAIIKTASNKLIIGCSNTTIPSSVVEIGMYAFSNAWPYQEVVIPDGVKKIDSDAYYGNYGLKRIRLPKSLEVLNEHSFESCHEITEILVDKENPVYDSRNDCNAVMETASNTLVLGCSGTVIPESTKSIGDYAFYSRLKSVTSLNIPDNVSDLGRNAFGCDGFTSCTINTIVLPTQLSHIDRPFGTSTIKEIVSKQEIPCDLTEQGTWENGVFFTDNQKYKNCILYVPKGSKEAYIQAEEWKRFKNIVEIDVDKLESITESSIEQSWHPAAYYDTGGMLLSHPQKGLNIIRMSDGTIRKVYVKK